MSNGGLSEASPGGGRVLTMNPDAGRAEHAEAVRAHPYAHDFEVLATERPATQWSSLERPGRARR